MGQERGPERERDSEGEGSRRPGVAGAVQRSRDSDERRRADLALLVAMRREDRRALVTFAARFRVLLLGEARRFGIARDEREDLVTEFLDDLALKLATAHGPAPRSLTTLVLVAFRNHATDARRRRVLRERQAEGLVTEPAACSEFARNATRAGPDGNVADTEAIVAFTIRLLERCSATDRALLVWSSQHVPLRDAAAWLGLSYGAAKTRLSRLRRLLARDAAGALAGLEPAHRATVERILARAGITLTPTSTHPAPDEGTGAAA